MSKPKPIEDNAEKDDVPELADADFARSVPATEAAPHLVRRHHRLRRPADAPAGD